MNRTHTRSIAWLAALLLVGWGGRALAASQEAAATQEESSGAPKKMIVGPVDSSQVIPPGPQWLGAPIMPGGRTVKEEPGRMTFEYDTPYAEVLAWYKAALSRYPDAEYRNWEEEMYIEDQGGSKWHAITISKTGGPKTEVAIQQDNWTWILSTLVIRFIGVFVVLLVLWIGLNVASAIMRRFVHDEGQAPAASAQGNRD